MAGKFEWKPFATIDINDPFFDSLKKDYPEFSESWFPKCVRENRNALVFYDAKGLGAFIALKRENEPIFLQDRLIPASPRLKVSTLRLAERFRRQRFGEGALGLVLWNWQRSKLGEVYLTVFPDHADLICQLERFGFQLVGHNERGECVYIRSRKNIDFSTPYKSFPFISPSFEKGGYLLVRDDYHDTLFPYSELKNTPQEMLQMDAANGITKVYIGEQWDTHYKVGEPIFIYRKHTGGGMPRYKSCLTSFCVVTESVAVKRNGKPLMTFESFCEAAGNRTIFSVDELRRRYNDNRNITAIKMLYCGYFGAGHNINMDWLDQNGLWSRGENEYPAQIQLSPQQCQTIWQAAKVDLDDTFGR